VSYSRRRSSTTTLKSGCSAVVRNAKPRLPPPPRPPIRYDGLAPTHLHASHHAPRAARLHRPGDHRETAPPSELLASPRTILASPSKLTPAILRGLTREKRRGAVGCGGRGIRRVESGRCIAVARTGARARAHRDGGRLRLTEEEQEEEAEEAEEVIQRWKSCES
jgi:hypothetical protein